MFSFSELQRSIFLPFDRHIIAVFLLFNIMPVSSAQQRIEITQFKGVAVFVHGAGGGGWEWNKWVHEFKKAGWKCVHPDLVPASNGIALTGFDDYRKQVSAWIKKHRKYPLVIVGASMGGVLALKANEEFQPDALVLVNSVSPKGIGNHKTKVFPPVVEWSKGTFKETQDSMPDSDTETIQFAYKHWRDESGAVLTAISEGISVDQPICPLLVILGDRDSDVPNAVGTEMAKQFMGDLKIYSGMSHVGPLLGTRAPEVALDTLAWLNKHVR